LTTKAGRGAGCGGGVLVQLLPDVGVFAHSEAVAADVDDMTVVKQAKLMRRRRSGYSAAQHQDHEWDISIGESGTLQPVPTLTLLFAAGDAKR